MFGTLRSWKRLLAQLTSRRAPIRTRRRAVRRLELEALEDRKLLSAVWISSTQNGAEGGPNGYFRLSRDTTAGMLTVNYALNTAGTTATSGSDFATLPGSVTFASGQATVDIPVTVYDDTIVESSETVAINLTGGGGGCCCGSGGYTLGSPSSASLTIADNDTPPSVWVDSVANAQEGVAAGYFRLKRSATAGALTVNYAIDGAGTSATNGTDFAYLPGTSSYSTVGSVTFADGQATADIPVDPTGAYDDSSPEGDETLKVSLQAGGGCCGPGGYTLAAPSSGSLTVADNDPVNRPPEFDSPNDPDTYEFSVPENSRNGGSVGTARATDPDGQPLTYSITAGNADGAFAINATTGAITVADASRLNYLATRQYVLSLRVSDGALTDTATATINVQPATGVIARNDSGSWYTTTAGTVLRLSAERGLLANDYSLRGRPLRITWYNDTPASAGSVTAQADGSFEFTPAAGFTGTVQFSYDVTDGVSTAGADVTLTVESWRLKASNDRYYISRGIAELEVRGPGVLVNDVSCCWENYEARLVEGRGPAQQDPQYPFSLNRDGSFLFRPRAGWDGRDEFRYYFRDAFGNVSTEATVTISINSKILGDEGDSDAAPLGGLVLAGGGTDVPAAMEFLIRQANGGDFVVLTASSPTAGRGSYTEWIWEDPAPGRDGLGGNRHLHSVEMIAIRDAGDANNPTFAERIRNAEAIFIGGGDQRPYVELWAAGGIRDAVNAAVRRGAAIGGTSAGLAVLGQVAFSAENLLDGGLYSREALQNPGTPEITLTKDFLQVPQLQNIVTETHVMPEDNDPQGRMGRLIAFLANIAAGDPGVSGRPRGIAVSAGTAVIVRPGGAAEVVGEGSAYFVTAPAAVPTLTEGPLNWEDIEVIRVGSGGTFNLDTWTGGPDRVRRYLLDVIDGRLAVEGNNDIY